MANKFILVPQEIYRGLTTFDTGEPNLDDVRRTLDKTRRVKEHPSAKNIRYNQELRRYLHLRNESQNRPVRVEMVASPKGAIMNRDQTHPSTNIAENDDDMWMSDDVSFSNYPREPPSLAYNFVPPLSESSYHPSIPPSLPRSSNVQSQRLPTPRQITKRKEQDYDEERKRIKINKEIKKSKIPVKKKQKKKVTASRPLPSTSTDEQNIVQDPILDAQKAPLSDSPLVSLQASKRDQVSEDFEGNKRRRKDNTRREDDSVLEKRLTARKERKKKKWDTIKKFRDQTVPLDQAAMAQARQDEKEAKRRRRQKVARTGRSPSPPLPRERSKRKYVIPEETSVVYFKRIKPASKKKSEQLTKAWMNKLKKVKSRTINKKWASKKPTQEDINRFKPSLW